MKSYIFRTFLILFLFFLAIPTASRAEWVFQIATGTAYNFPTPLSIKQNGEKDIDISAQYETRALRTVAPYYNLKIGKWFGEYGWEFESLHHKLYLDNKPDEVESFAISHGYNLNTINYVRKWKKFIWRVGAGIVMTHPETKVRGKRNEDDGGFNGFYISGITTQGAIEKRFDLSRHWFLSLEGKLTSSYAVIPIADGDATVPNIALHGLIGIGYRF